ncbi:MULTISPECIES: hypothetical protein [unclassified Streptomyces]|nr:MULTISPECIES: hypothetical protein [unclassified Streptomyces]MYS24273.1 hypothetical protein [Streptomyces sp. SID4948]
MLATGILDAATLGTGAVGDEFATEGVATGIKFGYSAFNVGVNLAGTFED